MVNYFICATPYHVVNSIIIQKNYFDKDTNILLLTSNSNGAYELYSQLVEEKIFDECFFVDDRVLRATVNNKFRYLKIILNRYLNVNLINNFVDLKRPADNIIVFSFTCFNALVQSKLINENHNCKVYVGEDGIRDYIYKDFGIKEPFWFYSLKGLRRLLGSPLVTLPSKCERILYRPELRNKIYKESNTMCINKNNKIFELRAVIKRVFNYTSEMDITDEYIYFDSVYDDDINEKQRELIYAISKKCHSFLLKKHPRNNFNYDGISVYPYSHIPWEVICLCSDMNDKTLITINSNACISPKFMLNCEPRVIFLYKLIFNKTNEIQMHKTEVLVNMLLELYKDKKRINIPNSYKELEAILGERA